VARPGCGGRTGDPDNVRDCLAIDLEISSNVPAELRDSDHNETATWFSGVGYRDCREEDEN